MAERHLLPADGLLTTYAYWPILVERAVDNVTAILRFEVHIAGIAIDTAKRPPTEAKTQES
jgi:hypothetical protein